MLCIFFYYFWLLPHLIDNLLSKGDSPYLNLDNVKEYYLKSIRVASLILNNLDNFVKLHDLMLFLYSLLIYYYKHVKRRNLIESNIFS